MVEKGAQSQISDPSYFLLIGQISMIYNPISSDLNPFLFLIKEGAFHTYINQVYALNKDKLIKKVIQSFVRPSEGLIQTRK